MLGKIISWFVAKDLEKNADDVITDEGADKLIKGFEEQEEISNDLDKKIAKLRETDPEKADRLQSMRLDWRPDSKQAKKRFGKK